MKCHRTIVIVIVVGRWEENKKERNGFNEVVKSLSIQKLDS